MSSDLLEVHLSSPRVALNDEMRAELDEYFAGRDAAFISGYIAGVRDNSEALMQEAFMSVAATEPMIEYLAERVSDEPELPFDE